MPYWQLSNKLTCSKLKTRKALGEDFLKKYNIKLGFMSFFLKAATLALQQYPVVNSVIDGN